MILNRVKAELKLMPLMLGKLLGGIVAVAGFTMAIVIDTRKVGSTFADILPFLAMGGAGIALFVIMSKLLVPKDTPMSGGNKCESMVSWGIFLLLALAFLLAITFFHSP